MLGVPSSSSTARSSTSDVSASTTPNRSPNRTGRSTPIINDDGSITVKREESIGIAGASSSASARSTSTRTKESMQERRVELFASKENVQRREVVDRFCAMLLPILLDVYSASVGVQVRSRTFQSMLKIIQYADVDYLPTILTVSQCCISRLSSLLNSFICRLCQWHPSWRHVSPRVISPNLRSMHCK